MFLVDSTIYIGLLRSRRDPVEALRPWLISDEILCCGVIRCEVIRGIVRESLRERMRELFDTLNTVAIDDSLWDDISHLAWTLDRRGAVVPLTDLMIAGCALRSGATVVTSDRHFRKVPDLAVLSALPAP